ncbi:TetR/AcrR family transcriptional regulator [Paractinoplanes rishiriensis]|uniref:Transcriptional regulator, TetR n=1 Tax=Paractinoplanes rishiriensis TaxID=1050105 RepID=A0A919MUG0_9ACTN|nr:TetR/AcrR family transcriptional regulator [Actinoplanes rishiriensis]GIE92555.1 putative transcriptional regulator, TetR [Actinoplanes rishiriensis]
MPGRREELLDAAIEVLGESGMHGLTHRRVDSAAGLPAGSTSNHFRTRDALLDAVVERFSARERQIWEDIAARLHPRTPVELALAMAELARGLTGPHRRVSLARYAILVEAGIQPSLRARLLATGAEVNTWFLTWLRLAGSTDPVRDAPLLMNHWSGLVLHELAVPDPAFDPSVQLTALVTRVIRPEVPA